jgi:hypothetical protein
MKSRAKSGNENFNTSTETNEDQIHYQDNEKVRNRSRHHKEEDHEIDDTNEVDKYEKSAGASQNTNNQRNFIYSHLTMLKIYSLVVLFLSALNLIFSILFM